MSPVVRGLTMLYLTTILLGFAHGMLPPIIPLMDDTFGVSGGLGAQIVTAFMSGRLIGQPLGGTLIDRFGTRPAVLGGPVAIAIAVSVGVVTQWFWPLLIGLFIAGAADSIWMLGREVAGVDLVKPNQRGRLIGAAYILHRAAGESLNAEGAFQHVMADLFGSVGVVISGGLILVFATTPDSGWFIVDPLLSIGIGLLILKSSWGLFMRVFKVLLEGTPKHLDMYRICSDMEDIPGVTIIHDVHAWTITSGYDALTAHVLVDPARRGEEDEMLSQLRQIAYGYGIGHVTIQLEYSASECEENHHVEHLVARSRS